MKSQTVLRNAESPLFEKMLYLKNLVEYGQGTKPDIQNAVVVGSKKRES